ncbi:MAG: MarR family transcriptional regulator [Erysipelotrichaceae bacterium]|nr:MarR family transcriptional regulator [Erysipelotrichaceae bacterium]
MAQDRNIELMNLIRSCENIIKRTRQNSEQTSHGHGRIIGAIYKNDGINQSELADVLEIRPQSLTRALAQLEEDGLIKRKRAENDRRNVTVHITEKGMERHDRFDEMRIERANRIFDCLDERQKDELYQLLSQVVETYCRKEKGDK